MYKVIDEGEHHVTLQHPAGHKVMIAKRGLSHKVLSKFKDIPRAQHLDEGGEVLPEIQDDRQPASDTGTPTVFDPLGPFNKLKEAVAPIGQAGEAIANSIKGGVKNAFSAPNPNYKGAPSLEKAAFSPEAGPQNISLGMGGEAEHQGPDMDSIRKEADQAQLNAYEAPVKAMQSAYEQIGNQQAMQAEKQATLEGQHAEALKNAFDAGNERLQALNAEHQKISEEYARGEIKPMQAWHNKAIGQKVSTAIGIILGGLGSGLTGGPNQALAFLNKQIDDDVDAQKANLGKTKSLLEDNIKQYGNVQDGMTATKLQLGAIAQAQMNQVASQSASPIAKQQAILNGQELKAKYLAPLQANLARSAVQQKLLAGASSGDVHPATLVDLVAKEPGEKKQILEEIKNREMIVRNGPKIIDLFKQASSDLSGVGRATALIKTPRSVEAMKGLLAPFFQTVDGTVRQAAFDAAQEAFLPSKADTPADIRLREKALKDWITSQTAAPTARSKGLNLDNFKATKANFPNTKSVGAPESYKKAGLTR